MNSDVRVIYHFPYTAVKPEMAVTFPQKGSDSGIAYINKNKIPPDGSKTFKSIFLQIKNREMEYLGCYNSY
jgi:hypothetical protein